MARISVEIEGLRTGYSMLIMFPDIVPLHSRLYLLIYESETVEKIFSPMVLQFSGGMNFGILNSGTDLGVFKLTE